MNRIFLLLFLCCLTSISYAQIAKDFTLGFHADLIKTDNLNFGDKAQLGMEGNYFFTKNLTATAGLEYWTGGRLSFVAGGRWYPVEDAFVRVRGLAGENDLSIGAGWSKPVDASWKFEAIADFYFSIYFAIRAGVVYVIKR